MSRDLRGMVAEVNCEVKEMHRTAKMHLLAIGEAFVKIRKMV